MNSARRPYVVILAATGLLLLSQTVVAALFEPGVGIGAEYTDNVELVSENKEDNLIGIAYVGASLIENKGSLKYDVTTSVNQQHYTQGAYPDKRYFNLSAGADWEMIRNRFNWILSDHFTQYTVNVLDSNTPDNIQDTNVFSIGANIRFPISARQNFSLYPSFTQYYYEAQSTDNDEYGLTANWNYKIFRLTDVGLNLGVRKVKYTENDDPLATTVNDTTFTQFAFVLNTQGSHSFFSINLGATNAEKEGGESFSGFTGNINWVENLSSRSTLNMYASTGITNAGRAAQDVDGEAADGVQVSRDVVRNNVVNIAYIRNDALLHSNIWAKYHELKYSDLPLDRVITSTGLKLNYPITQLLIGGAYATYNHIKAIDTDRLDENYFVGSNLKYQFSRKWHALLDLKYRDKTSTLELESYNEFSVFASLIYGFGDVRRPTRGGAFGGGV